MIAISHRRLAFVALIVFSGPLVAQPSGVNLPRPLLNSERIAEKFGSYGIEVKEQTADSRISNLFSLENNERIGRTFAVVLYPEIIDASLASEHAEILSGESIGALLTQRGWTVQKLHRYFGEIESTTRVRGLMGGIAPQALAIHIYDLIVSKSDRSATYATIIEVHHPDYLSSSDLLAIYGGAEASPPDETYSLEEILSRTREKMNYLSQTQRSLHRSLQAAVTSALWQPASLNSIYSAEF